MEVFCQRASQMWQFTFSSQLLVMACVDDDALLVHRSDAVLEPSHQLRNDLVGVNKDSYLVLDKLPPEYDSRVKAMEAPRALGHAEACTRGRS